MPIDYGSSEQDVQKANLRILKNWLRDLIAMPDEQQPQHILATKHHSNKGLAEYARSLHFGDDRFPNIFGLVHRQSSLEDFEHIRECLELMSDPVLASEQQPAIRGPAPCLRIGN